MGTKVFIDGKEGTTGLRIYERFLNRKDIDLLIIPEEDRKNAQMRKQYINASDITFLCLPDAAAIEAVQMVENSHTKIIDASTAHRTLDNWAYGFPELDPHFLEKIQTSRFISVPGCHASGFIALIYPLISKGILQKDYPLSCTSITGYSGGGKSMIAGYEEQYIKDYIAPRQYGMNQNHKHLKEMKAITGINMSPIFEPFVSNFHSGMEVSIGIQTSLLTQKLSIQEIHQFFTVHYQNQEMVTVMPFCPTATEDGFLSAVSMNGFDNMLIYISGNEERVLLTAVYDNLGKGASGAAIECLNLMLGLNPAFSLNIRR